MTPTKKQLFELYLKHKYDEEGFINEYCERYPQKTKPTNNASDYLNAMLKANFDTRILAKLFWLGDEFRRQEREVKLKRILNGI